MNRMPIPPRLSLRRIIVSLLIGAVIGAITAVGLGAATRSSYAADRSVLLRVWDIDALVLTGQTADISTADLSDAATIFTSSDVVDEARATLGDGDVTRSELVASISAAPSSSSNFIDLEVTGPTAAEADRRAQAVSAAFVLVVRTKVLASANQIADATTGTADEVPADIAARAEAIASLDPVQVYTTELTQRSGLSWLSLAGGGAVAGLALVAIVVVLLAFGPARLRRPADVLSVLGLPAATWDADADDDADDDGSDGIDGGSGNSREHGLTAELLDAARAGVVAICPARPEDVVVAEEFAMWLVAAEPRATPIGRNDNPSHGLVVIDPPASTLAVDRIEGHRVAVAVLVTQAGVACSAITQSAAVLYQWRTIDAVVLVG